MNSEKQKVLIVSDSACDIPSELLKKYQIEVVDLSFTIGGETYYGNDAMESKELLRRMEESSELAQTAMPSVGQFEAMYEKALERAHRVFSMHVSQKLSGTIESALLAAEKFGDKVQVFDTKNLSMGQGLQVIESAKIALENFSLPDIKHAAEELRARTFQMTGFDTIEYLRRGGRIGAAGSVLGSILNLKPSIYVDAEGGFHPAYKSRGDKGAIRDTLKFISEKIGEKRARMAVGYAFNRERADKLLTEIKERFHLIEEPILYEAGPIISTHTGPGWGVSISVEK